MAHFLNFFVHVLMSPLHSVNSENFTEVKVVVVFDAMMSGLPTHKENFAGQYFVNLNYFTFGIANHWLFSCLFVGNGKALVHYILLFHGRMLILPCHPVLLIQILEDSFCILNYHLSFIFAIYVNLCVCMYVLCFLVFPKLYTLFCP